MKTGKNIACFVFALFCAFSLVTCSNDDSATVTIDLGSMDIAGNVQKTGLFDRIVNLLTFSNTANAAAPANVTSLVLTVSASDFPTIIKYYPVGTTKIKIGIRSGKQRKITVTANIDPSDTRAVYAYAGTAITDLKAGEIKNINLIMVPSETRLVIPDYLNHRVIQIDDMTGANWKVLDGTNVAGISTGGTLYPYDITFDAQGRIYVANNTTASYTNLFRIDSILASGTTVATEIVSGKDVPAIQWITIDMKNSVLYFATSTILYRSGLDGSSIASLATMPYPIYGINVDDDGNVYVTYSNGGGYNVIRKYNPSNFSTPVASFDTNAYFGNTNYWPRGVVVKSGKVYVTMAQYVLSAYSIVQLDSNLNFVASYGTGTSTAGDTTPGHFYGPSHFVATLNRRLYIMDDSGLWLTNPSYDRLVGMDDINGTNWQTYGSSGGLEDQFRFYAGC